jgi:uncharacterized protein (DUF58 family)
MALLIGCAILFIVCWLVSLGTELPRLTLFGVMLLALAEAIALASNGTGFTVLRRMAERFGNGEANSVQLEVHNLFPFVAHAEIIEEFPQQLQVRNNSFVRKLKGRQQQVITYHITPSERGDYAFGNTVIMACSALGLLRRRIVSGEATSVQVFPNFIQMRKYQLLAHTAQQAEAGSRKVRKLGSSLEFEQIKEYVTGDDIRQINWKATARRNQLMVNHYMDERSQQVYCIIDKGRLMKMPFEGLTLLDYAINASLVLANVCLTRQDRFGLITFSHKPGTVLAADRKPVQLEYVLQNLYHQQTDFLESDFERLFLQVRMYVKNRALLMLFTNFESLSGMKRQLPFLKQLAKYHLLMVIFFENSELTELGAKPVSEMEGIYAKTIAEKFVFEKKMIVRELQRNGILAVLSTPKNLTINAVNKYLEIKNKQAL